MFGSLAIPGDGLLVVLTHTTAVSIHRTEASLCVGVALIGSFEIPGDGLPIVLGHTAAKFIDGTEVQLSDGVALIGGLAKKWMAIADEPVAAADNAKKRL